MRDLLIDAYREFHDYFSKQLLICMNTFTFCVIAVQRQLDTYNRKCGLNPAFFLRYGGDTIQLAPPFFSTPVELNRLIDAQGESINATA